MAGFFEKKQFFNSSLTVSIKARFSQQDFVRYVHQKLCLFQRFTVIHIPRSEHEIEDFTLIVDDQVKLKPEEPSHGAFPTFGETLKSLVNQYALVPAYTQRG